MLTMKRYMGFLFLLRCLVLTETWPEIGESRFISAGYSDDQQFVRFDSDSESQRAKSQAPWMDKMDQEYWEGEMLLSTVAAQNYRVDLQTLRHYYNQSEGGVHIFQRMCGCEVFPDLKFKRGFKQYAYDGHDYIALDTETYTWTAAVPEPVNTKLKIEAERSLAERKKAYLEETCVLWLHKYLEIGKEMLKRADLPSAQVTCHTDPDGEVTLQCRAQDFYPEEIHLTWPAGDGTFQKWAALGITSGQEGKYTCQKVQTGVELLGGVGKGLVSLRPERDQGLSFSFSTLELQSSCTWIIVGGIAVVLLLIAVIAGVVIWRNENSGRQDGRGSSGSKHHEDSGILPELAACLSVPKSSIFHLIECYIDSNTVYEQTCKWKTFSGRCLAVL
uniref:Ig-like domain-containing protein n=1 Tax=Vombatus ursinus TaxID=29139 RepID=A0A4X2L8C1_VOMUR